MTRRITARVVSAVVLAAGTVAGLTVPATADPSPVSVVPPPSPMLSPPTAANPVEAMRRDLGLTRDQALRRLNLEAVANRVNDQLRSALSSAFGGSHYDPKLGELVVGVTDRASFDKVRAAGARPRLVHFSANELESTAEALNTHVAQAPDAVSGWYVDSSDNAVVLTTATGTAALAENFVRASGVQADAVRVVESREAPRPLGDVIGGNPYSTSAGARCSVGFAVAGGFVTAGHCGKQGETTTQPSGSFAGSSFPGNDYAHVKLGPGETPRPLVNNYQGGTVGVAGSQEATEGSSVCRSGATTGWHCGTIEAKNQTVAYPEGTVQGLTRTNVCAEPGDSGGSWLSGEQAQGVTSGGSGNCTSGGTTYFQPVNEILNTYGLTLLTK